MLNRCSDTEHKRIFLKFVLFVTLLLFGRPSYLIAQDDQNQTSIKLILTQAEQEFITNHPVIKVSNEMDYPPFDFAIEGEPHGYSIDLLNLLKKRIGIQIEYINGYTWHELVEMFKDRKIDLLHTLAKTPERNKFAIFSDRFFRDRQVYITRKENPEIKDISQLYGKTISQAKGWSTTEYFQANFPQISLLIVNSLEEMFDAVAYGDAYATVVDESAAAYTMKKLGMRDLKIAGWFKEIDKGKGMNFYFAAQKDAHELISLLNKALASVTTEEREALERKWFGTGNQQDISENAIALSPEEEIYLKHV
jgi:ABC-type amino acid transport substrate-binding protein